MSNPYSASYVAPAVVTVPVDEPDNVKGAWPKTDGTPLQTQTAQLNAIEFSHRRVLKSIPENHQTLIVLQLSKSDDTSKTRERLTRFVGSLNHSSTIKADVVTISDGKLYEGIYFGGKTRGGYALNTSDTKHAQVFVFNPGGLYLS